MGERKLPDTSISAYKQSKELSKAHRAKILEALIELGSATYEEISVKTGIESHGVGRRLSELERDGKIHKTGEKRPTKSSRNANCYMQGKAPEHSILTEIKSRAKPITDDQNKVAVSGYVRRRSKKNEPIINVDKQAYLF